MNVLGIETSCDETAAAVVADGRDVLSNVVYSQAIKHAPFGGVVPELASRCHLEALPDVIERAVRESGVGWEGIDRVAVTYGPGLATSLLVGLAAAKGLAIRINRPLTAVNHIEAHIYSIFIGCKTRRIENIAPYLCLVVSGGHTCLILIEALGKYQLLGQTLDDAAGEAFDKGASLLGLGYPGGPAIETAAAGHDASGITFPRSRPRKEICRITGLNPRLCFSFSGLKTALLYHLRDNPLPDDPQYRAETVGILAASYQEAIVDALVSPCETAMERFRIPISVAGGVSLNRRLREKLADLAGRFGVPFTPAAPEFCADNAAMVAGLAGAGRGLTGEDAFGADATPDLETGEIWYNLAQEAS